MEVNHLPDYGAFTSSLFIVIGIANLVIFNRVFTTTEKADRKRNRSSHIPFSICPCDDLFPSDWLRGV